MMKTQPTVTDLLKTIKSTKDELNKRLQVIKPENIGTPLPNSHWSTKDTMAHIYWHEKEITQAIQHRILRGSEWWMLTLDERNHNIYEKYKTITWHELQVEAKNTHDTLIKTIQQLKDEDLTDSHAMQEMPTGYLLWQLIADNTYLHYEDHFAALDELIQLLRLA